MLPNVPNLACYSNLSNDRRFHSLMGICAGDYWVNGIYLTVLIYENI